MILVLKCINLKYNTSKVVPIERHAQPLSATLVFGRIGLKFGVKVAQIVPQLPSKFHPPTYFFP